MLLSILSNIGNWTWIPTLTFGLSYFAISSIYSFLDITQPEFYSRTAINNIKPLTFNTWARVMYINIINILFGLLVGFIGWVVRLGLTENPTVPDFVLSECAIHLVIFVIWEECWMTLIHWAVHQSGYFYKKIHSMHHEFPIPYAITGLYCTLYEMALINLPISIGMWIALGSHPYTQAIWLFIVSFTLCSSHSSHQIFPKYIHNVEPHAIHHINPQVNFGSEFLERLFNY